MFIKAVIRDGVAVPDSPVSFPEGTEVAIVARNPERAELQREFEFWNDVSADGWEKFLEWEREVPS